MAQEPRLHTFLIDCLPDDHPWSWKSVDCVDCGVLVHSIPNECMSTWVETGVGPMCLDCFVALLATDKADDDAIALPDDYAPPADPPQRRAKPTARVMDPDPVTSIEYRR